VSVCRQNEHTEKAGGKQAHHRLNSNQYSTLEACSREGSDKITFTVLYFTYCYGDW